MVVPWVPSRSNNLNFRSKISVWIPLSVEKQKYGTFSAYVQGDLGAMVVLCVHEGFVFCLSFLYIDRTIVITAAKELPL